MKVLLEKMQQRSTDKPKTLTFKDCEEAEKLCDQYLCQHVFADLMWEIIIGFVASSRNKREGYKRRLLQRRVDFHAKAYPGLSAAHAWALEALADSVKRADASGGYADSNG